MYNCCCIIVILWGLFIIYFIYTNQEKETFSQSISPKNISSVLKRYEIEIHDINTNKKYSFASDPVHGFKIVPHLTKTLWVVKKSLASENLRQHRKLTIYTNKVTKMFHVNTKNELSMTNSLPVNELMYQTVPGGNKMYIYYQDFSRKRKYLYLKNNKIIGKEYTKGYYPLEFELYGKSATK